MSFNQTLPGMQKKKKRYDLYPDKYQSLAVILDIAEMIELADSELKTVINRFHMFCKNMSMTGMEDIKRYTMLRWKIITKMKNTQNGINGWLDKAGEKVHKFEGLLNEFSKYRKKNIGAKTEQSTTW